MRERRSWVLPSLYLAALGSAVVIAYFYSTEGVPFQMEGERQGAAVGVAVFLTIAYAQMALLLLLAPVFSSGSLTIEKEQRTLAMLLTSLLSAVEIWAGKFVSAMLFTTLLLFSGLPVLGLAFSLGGVGPEDLARAVAMTLLVLASISAIGLYFSSIFRRSVHSTAVSYAFVIALTAVTFIIFSILQSHWQSSQARWNIPAEGGTAGLAMPRYYSIPLYLNPFYALTASLMRGHQRFPDWIICALVFFALGVLAAIFGCRNIHRRGESG